MLIEIRNYQDLERVLPLLKELDAKTDRRYTKDVGGVFNVTGLILKKMGVEVQYRQKLQSYKTQGFLVDNYLNKVYPVYETMVTELNQVMQNIENLISIKNQYDAIASRVPEALRQKFVPLLKQPEKYLEIVSLWTQIQASVRS